ncbi:hypothetical protein [Streptomyces albireticuli]|nr:hypothetical protein [Streptomyces albireticuli]MCD9194251.1 hypothetical protein [Streptomyces albireticuli]
MSDTEMLLWTLLLWAVTFLVVRFCIWARGFAARQQARVGSADHRDGAS